MHKWPLVWFCSLYFSFLDPAAYKATWDCWNYPAHMQEFSCADCIQESSEMGLLESCGPNHYCSLCRGRTSSHSGLSINPKDQVTEHSVLGIFLWLFNQFLLFHILFFSVNVFSLSVLLLYFGST
jgi:hypothetical protein